MKKLTKLTKRTLFGVVPAIFACSLCVGLLHDVKPVDDAGVQAVDSPYNTDVENKAYTLRKTSDHSFELLFSAQPSDWRGIHMDDLKELAYGLKDCLSDLIHTKMEDLSSTSKTITEIRDGWQVVEGSDAPAGNESVIPDIPVGATDLDLRNPVNTYVSLETFAELIYNYSRFVRQEDGTYLASTPSLSRIGTNNYLAYVSYYTQDYFNRNTSYELNAANYFDVLHDTNVLLANRLVNYFGSYGLSNLSDAYTYMCARTAQLDMNYQVTLDNVSAMLMLVHESTIAGSDLGVRNLLSTLGGNFVVAQIKDLVNNGTPEQIGNFFKEVPVKVIELVLSISEFKNADLEDMINNVPMDKWIEIIDEVGVQNVKEVFNSIDDFDKDRINSLLTSRTSPKDFWNAIKNIEIDGIQIMVNKQFKIAKIKELLKTFDGFKKMSTFTDDEFRRTFFVEMDTAVEEMYFYGTIGFKGDCTKVRKICKIIADTIDYKREGDVGYFNINLPKMLTALYEEGLTSSILSDELKHELWDMAFSSFDQIYNYVHSKTIADLKEYADDIDYYTLAEDITDADELERIFGTRKLSQEQLDKFIDLCFKAIAKGSRVDMDDIYEIIELFLPIDQAYKDFIDKYAEKIQNILERIAARNYSAEFIHDYLSRFSSEEFNEKVYNKICNVLDRQRSQNWFNRFQRYLEKAYARVPESIRAKTVMSYYEGDGVFNGERSFSINWIKWIRKVPQIGNKLADAMTSLFDRIPQNFHINLTINTKNMYRVSYHDGSTVKTGALPAGLEGDYDVEFYSNIKETTVSGVTYPIVRWAEYGDFGSYDYSVVRTMPERDIDVYPVYFTGSADVSATYSPTSTHKVGVTPNIETDYAYEYVWTKDGVETSITDASFEVGKVSDSGVYVCTVDGVEVATINVVISKAQVTAPTQTTPIVYDQTEHAYYESFGATSEDDLLFYGTGDTAATDSGDYVAELNLKDSDNYEWAPGSDTSYAWTISRGTIVVDVEYKWTYSTPFTYDGTEKTVALTAECLADLPEGVHVEYSKEYSATNAGSYVAKVTVVADDPQYDLVGVTTDELSWVIAPQHISIPTGMCLKQDNFVYDGTSHAVDLDTDTYPLHDAISYVLSGDASATDSGDYTVHVDYVVTDPNYVLDPGYVQNFSWKIEKYTIDATKITWNYTEAFYYDGSMKSVRLLHVPAYVQVTYENCDNTEPGTYAASATIKCDNKNFRIKVDDSGEYYSEYTFHLNWTINQTYKDFASVEKDSAGNPFATVSLSKPIKDNPYLHANKVDTGSIDYSSLNDNEYIASGAVAYDINFTDVSGEVIDLATDVGCTYTVRVLIPTGIESAKDIMLVYVANDGTIVKLDAKVEGNYFVFESEHLSTYSVVKFDTKGSDPKTFVIVGVAILFCLQFLIIVILESIRRSKRRRMSEHK